MAEDKRDNDEADVTKLEEAGAAAECDDELVSEGNGLLGSDAPLVEKSAGRHYSDRNATYLCSVLFLIMLALFKFEGFQRRAAERKVNELVDDVDKASRTLRRERKSNDAMISMLSRANETTHTRAQGELRSLFQMLRRANDTSRLTIQDLISQLKRERRRTHLANKALASEKQERDELREKLRSAMAKFHAEKSRLGDVRTRVRARIAALTAGLRGFQEEMGEQMGSVDGIACTGKECKPIEGWPLAGEVAGGVGFAKPQKLVLTTDQNQRLKSYLRHWAKVINGESTRYECKNASVPRAVFRSKRTAKQARGYGTRDADSWYVCYDQWEPWKTGCVGISVGIGGEWGFEDGFAQMGCNVYAFDPTEDLIKRHTQHANDPEQKGRMHFEAAGLGGEIAQKNTNSKRYGGFDLNGTNILPLSAIMSRATAKSASPIVDVLKIDCEGCEWTAFQQVARRAPNLLSRVRTVLIEIHSIQRYGLQESWEVHRLMDFLMNHHGFRVYRSGFNKGWPGARNQILNKLVNAGFPRMPCCWLLHLIRPPSNTTWLREAAGATLPAPAYEFPL